MQAQLKFLNYLLMVRMCWVDLIPFFFSKNIFCFKIKLFKKYSKVIINRILNHSPSQITNLTNEDLDFFVQDFFIDNILTSFIKNLLPWTRMKISCILF